MFGTENWSRLLKKIKAFLSESTAMFAGGHSPPLATPFPKTESIPAIAPFGAVRSSSMSYEAINALFPDLASLMAGGYHVHPADGCVPLCLLPLPRHLLAAMAAGGRHWVLPLWAPDAHRALRRGGRGEERRLLLPGLPGNHLLCM